MARLTHLLVAVPLVALVGVAIAAAASPDGDVTTREREVVVRLTRAGAQRFDADGAPGWSDAVETAGAATPEPVQVPASCLPDPAPCLAPRHDRVILLDAPASSAGQGCHAPSPSRGRAPPSR